MTDKRSARSSNSTLEVSGNIGDVSAEMIALGRVRAVPVSGGEQETFTRGQFEDALDKVSRPVKGKYADVPYSSEDLIRDKRTEVELEDR